MKDGRQFWDALWQVSQERFDWMHEKVNGKTWRIIDNFVLCIRLLKKGYADYALDLFCMTMPMRVGHELAVSKWLPKGLNTDKLWCLTEAHVNALLEPMSGSSA